MTQVISVSIRDEHKQFLKETGQSASKLLQEAIDFMIYQSLEHKSLKSALEATRQRLLRAHNYINKRGLNEDYAREIL